MRDYQHFMSFIENLLPRVTGSCYAHDMSKTIELIASDMGGVLALHSDGDLEVALLNDFGLSGYPSFAALNPALPRLLQRHSKNEIDEEKLWREFTQITGVEVPTAQSSLWGRYFKPDLDPAMLAIFKELKEEGFRLVCATNTEPAHYHHHLKEGHYEIFDRVYASCEMGHAKPETAFFTHIIQAEQTDPKHILFIDDLEENCEAADRLGITAYLYTDVVDFRWALAGLNLI
jgi:HAD superfamily hydrolase (TIGR01509 family)